MSTSISPTKTKRKIYTTIMLFVWDVHINAKQSAKILQELRQFVDGFPAEKNIVFLGDYMYMFSYDRQALADLFDFFLLLWDEGKNVYVMAGNHDWLNQHFIYHEWKKIADILNARTSENKIHFVTEPSTYLIEWKEFFFLPFNKEFLHTQKETFLEKYATSIPWSLADAEKNNIHISNENDLTNDIVTPSAKILTDEISPSASLFSESIRLLASKNSNEQLSWALNMTLFEIYFSDTTTAKKPILVHHYYTANTSFPWQFAKFDYKDISLHPLRMEVVPTVISGHLHKAFTHKNYFCVGSTWHSSSTERDQQKRFWQYNPEKNLRNWKAININPYLTLDLDATGVWTTDQSITNETITAVYQNVYKNHISWFGENIDPWAIPTFDASDISLIFYTQKNISDIEQLLSSEIRETIHDIQYKQKLSTQEDMTELLDISQYNLQQSLLDWKELVKKYILSRYWTESEKYRTLLSELNIL